MSKKSNDSAKSRPETVTASENGEQKTAEQQETLEQTQQESEMQEKQEPEIQEKLEQALSTIESLKEQNLRQLAEFDNYRKNMHKQMADLVKNAAADTITKILPVIDDMERAIANNVKSDDIAAIREGFQLIYSKLMHTLQSEGLSKIEAVGKPFDTDLHEAIAVIPASDDNAKGVIVDCTRDGYRLNDKVLRISQVVVAN